MPVRTDRAGMLLEKTWHRRRELPTPEGVPLHIHVAGHGERLLALITDLFLMTALTVFIYLLIVPVFMSGMGESVGLTVILFLAFVVHNLYFLHFELAWQGRTPGKRIFNLRVINRHGGELTPSAVIARNLTREVEIFLPLSLFVIAAVSSAESYHWALFGWVAAVSALPFFNRDHLRAGDLIGGTQVISMRRDVLLKDLSTFKKEGRAAYLFTPEQLAIYGVFEVQVLEDTLRRFPSDETRRLLEGICSRICNKIGWRGKIPAQEVRPFLTDFYIAERADLERRQLFGRFKADKNSG